MSDVQATPGPLAGIRMLELADEKGQFCGKLIGDLGADVVKIEPPGGEACRLVGPFLDDVRPRARGGWTHAASRTARFVRRRRRRADPTTRGGLHSEELGEDVVPRPGHLVERPTGQLVLYPAHDSILRPSFVPPGSVPSIRKPGVVKLQH